jgi:hypothetical protein
MFVKNALRAFNIDTKIVVFMRTNDDDCGNIHYKELDYKTVGDFMISGLMNYMEVDIPLHIINNHIVIYIK